MLKKYVYLQAMPARDMNEHARASTPLELFFDLVTVIAIASAAAGLHHGLLEGHIVESLFKYLGAFFAIWWAWMNYSWFASAYDNDDTLFRLITLWIMAGALTMAAGIGPFFAQLDLTVLVSGFVMMRLGMIALWLRAARHDLERRTSSLIYAVGIAIAQCYWLALLAADATDLTLFAELFALGIVLELAVPALAEWRAATPWHSHHITERYGLLNLIVLGETLLAGSMALAKLDADHMNWALVSTAICALLILFSMWWLYFSRDNYVVQRERNVAFIWGYGHFLIYLSGAAVGAGFAVLVDGHASAHIDAHTALSETLSLYTIALPLALYWLGVWLVRDQFIMANGARFVLPVFAVLMLLMPLLGSLMAISVLAVVCVIVRSQCPCVNAAKH